MHFGIPLQPAKSVSCVREEVWRPEKRSHYRSDRRALNSGGRTALRRSLRIEAASYYENAGQNGFGFPLYEALAESRDFLESAGELLA